MSSPPTSDRAVQVQADCEKPGMVALLHLIDKRNKNKSKNSQKKKQGFHDDPPSDDIGLCIGNLFGKNSLPAGLASHPIKVRAGNSGPAVRCGRAGWPCLQAQLHLVQDGDKKQSKNGQKKKQRFHGNPPCRVKLMFWRDPDFRSPLAGDNRSAFAAACVSFQPIYR